MHEASVDRWVKHPMSKVWRALSKPELAERWLPFEGFQAVPGARFSAVGPMGRASCEVLEVEAPRRVRCRWEEGGEDSFLWIELTEEGVGTRVSIRHQAPSERSATKLHAMWLLVLEGPLEGVLVGAAVGTTSMPALVWGGVGLALVGTGALVALVELARGPAAGQDEVDGGVVGQVEETVRGDVPAATEGVGTEERSGPRKRTGSPEAQPVWGVSDQAQIQVYETELPSTLHPLYPRTDADRRAQRLVWAPLFEHSAIREVVSPVFSDVEARGATLLVEVAEGLTFHDGEAVQADDVCFSIDTVLAAASSTLPFRDRGDLVGCDVLGPREARIRLRAELADARQRAAVPLVPSHAFDPAPEADLSVRPIGSGPYRGMRGVRTVRFERVGPGHGPRTIAVSEAGDPLVSSRTLQAAGVHVVVDLPASILPDLGRSEEVRSRQWNPRQFTYVALSPRLPASLRGRIASAVDRGELLRAVYGNPGPLAMPITGPFAASSPFTDRRVKAGRPAKDFELVRRSPLILAHGPDGASRDAARVLRKQLVAVGLPVELQADTRPEPKRHDLWLGHFRYDLAEDPSELLSPTPLGARSSKVDELLQRMRNQARPVEQADAAHAVHRAVFEEHLVVPLFDEVRYSGMRQEVDGPMAPGSYWDWVEDWRVSVVDRP